MKDSLKNVILWSDGCSSQFRPKYVLALTHFDKSVQLEWHYNKAHHGRKGPIDGVRGTIQRVVFGLVKSNKITINTAEEFATEASKVVPSIQSTFPKMMR